MTSICRIGVLAVLSVSACTRPEPPRAPDLLVVVMDTVRADAVGVYGAGRPGITPQLDQLAAQGVRFADVTTSGTWTWPSHTSLFTGLPPWTHGARFVPPDDAALVLGERNWSVGAFPDTPPTLAERLTAAGYRTVSLSENPLIGPALGSTRGFSVAENPPASSGMGWVLDRAAAVLAEDDDRPLLLFVNVLDAHHPWLVTPVSWLEPHAATLHPSTAPDWLRPWLFSEPDGVVVDLLQAPPGGRSAEEAFHTGAWQPPPDGLRLFRDLYDASVQRADYKLHRLVQAWTASGRSGVVAVTSDHGELLGEHGLLFHGRTVWPELTQVPLVVVAPGRLPAGATVDAPVQMSDLHDTLLELSGLPAGPRSLVGVARGTAEAPAGPIAAAAWPDAGFGERVGGALQHSWQMWREGDQAVLSGADGSVRMFDVQADPTWTTDLCPRRPSDCARLDAARRAGLVVAPAGRAVGTDPQLIQQLEALGYMERLARPEALPE